MAFTRVASVKEFAPSNLLEARAAGRVYALCNVGGEVYALDGICPHNGGPLAQGALYDHKIVCPWHAWEFDCRTGENDFNPAVRISKADVLVRDGEVYLDILDAGTS